MPPAEVAGEAKGEVSTEDLQRGDSVRAVLGYTGYDADELRDAIELQLSKRIEAGLISAEDERELMPTTSMALGDYTCLVYGESAAARSVGRSGRALLRVGSHHQ